MINHNRLAAIVLAAGKGTRMKSSLPKVLHPLGGRPMLGWVTRALEEAGISDICLVLSEELAGFEAFLADSRDLAVSIQKNRQGTGDAVAAAASAFEGVKVPRYAEGWLHQGCKIEATHLLICAGDTPAIEAGTLRKFIEGCLAAGAGLGVLGIEMPEPKGYGRLVVDSGGRNLKAIVEEKDADEATRRIRLCNSGVIFAETRLLFELLDLLTPNNAQNEYYLTDCFKIAAEAGERVHVEVTADWRSFQGINDRQQLAMVGEFIMERTRQSHMAAGVTFHLPATNYIEADVTIATDVVIGAGAGLYGSTRVESEVTIGSGVVLHDVHVKRGARIEASSYIRNGVIQEGEHVPPLFVRID